MNIQRVCLKLSAGCAVDEISTDINGSMSVVTEALLDSAGEAAPSAWLKRELPSVRRLPQRLDSVPP